MNEVTPEFFPYLRKWVLEHEGQTLRANSLRELGGLLPPGYTIAGYHPNGFTAVRDYDGLASPRLVIEKRGLTIRAKPKTLPVSKKVERLEMFVNKTSSKPNPIPRKERYYPHTRMNPSSLEPIPHKPVAPAEIEYARAAYAAGASYAQLAKDLKRTRNSIASLVRRYRLTRAN